MKPIRITPEMLTSPLAVKPCEWRHSGAITTCDDWKGADFRIDTQVKIPWKGHTSGGNIEWACNLFLTGRKVHTIDKPYYSEYRNDFQHTAYVLGKIEFCDEDNPSVFAGCRIFGDKQVLEDLIELATDN